MFLPPLTTLVTRLIEMSWSLRIRPAGEIFCFLLNAIKLFCCGLRLFLFVKAGLTRCVDQSFHAAVVDVAAAVINNARDAGSDRTLGYGFTDRLCCVHVTAGFEAEAF